MHVVILSDKVADTTYSKKKCNDGSILSSKEHLAGDVHGAPPGSFVSQLAEIMAGIKTPQKMAEFWLQVVGEVCYSLLKNYADIEEVIECWSV